MTTQSTAYPEANVPSARRTSTDGRSSTDTLEGAVPEMKETLRQMVETGKTRVNEWNGELHEGLRAKPIQSVLIAAAVGAVIGVIVGWRSR